MGRALHMSLLKIWKVWFLVTNGGNTLPSVPWIALHSASALPLAQVVNMVLLLNEIIEPRLDTSPFPVKTLNSPSAVLFLPEILKILRQYSRD